jgi:hypothetical protein
MPFIPKSIDLAFNIAPIKLNEKTETSNPMLGYYAAVIGGNILSTSKVLKLLEYKESKQPS